MDKIYIFFNSLEEREKIILIAGMFASIIIIGVIFITIPHYNSIKKLELKLVKEIENYNLLREIAAKYKAEKPAITIKPPSLSDIDEVSKNANIKEKLNSVKPINYQNKEAFEIVLKEVSPDELTFFINSLKKKHFSIFFISIDNPRENNQLNVKLIVGK